MYSIVSRMHLCPEYYRVYGCVHIYVITYGFSPHVTPRKDWIVVTWKRRVKPRDRDLATKITEFLAHAYEQINCAMIFLSLSAYSFLMLKNIFSFKEICKMYCYAWFPFLHIYILYIYYTGFIRINNNEQSDLHSFDWLIGLIMFPVLYPTAV